MIITDMPQARQGPLPRQLHDAASQPRRARRSGNGYACRRLTGAIVTIPIRWLLACSMLITSKQISVHRAARALRRSLCLVAELKVPIG